jgi:hypothetical protein
MQARPGAGAVTVDRLAGERDRRQRVAASPRAPLAEMGGLVAHVVSFYSDFPVSATRRYPEDPIVSL